MKREVMSTILKFITAVGIASLLAQTYEFATSIPKVISGLAELPIALQIWFFGIHIQDLFGSFDLEGAWTALIVIALGVIGLAILGGRAS